ncbi:unnamed protein product [Colias eurytheme]|nr:unnamed protein product [Colias eurytheme]
MKAEEDHNIEPLLEAVYSWLLQMAKMKPNCVLTENDVRVMGIKFNATLKIVSDVNKINFLEKFEERYGTISEFNNDNKTGLWRLNDTSFDDLMKDLKLLSPMQVYMADESGLYWRLPAKNSEKLYVFNRITFLLCTNITGQHRLAPLVIGKYKDPKSLKDIELPIHYFSQRDAYINRRLFKKWFFECFVPEVKLSLREQGLPEKAVLLIDSSCAHPHHKELRTEDDSIITLVLPYEDNYDYGRATFDYIKREYKNNFLRMASSSVTRQDFTLKFNYRDMAFLLADCWNTMPEHVVRSWGQNVQTTSRVYIADTDDSSTDEFLEQFIFRLGISIENLRTWYMGIYENKNGTQYLRCADIAAYALTIDLDGIEETEDINYSDKKEDLRPLRAKKNFDLCIQWAEENGYSSADISMLKQMKDKIANLKPSNVEVEKDGIANFKPSNVEVEKHMIANFEQSDVKVEEITEVTIEEHDFTMDSHDHDPLEAGPSVKGTEIDLRDDDKTSDS